MDSVGNQLQLAQGAATTRSKNDQKNLVGETPTPTETPEELKQLSEKLIPVEKHLERRGYAEYFGFHCRLCLYMQ